jgi:TonB family protein
VAASQPVAPAPRNQPALNLNMSAPTVASRNAGRLVDGSVPNIGDPVAANPIIATTSGASLPSIARADNPPAPPITAPAATAPARTIREPKLISDPRLSYPATARQTKVEGDVLVTADVDATGKVKSAKAVSGPALLRVGAEDTVKGWKYEPATINGRPVATQVTVKLEFRLK